MKYIITAFASLALVLSCNKNETSNTSENKEPNAEVSLTQDARKLKNDKGEELSVTYFAEGDVVAAKVQKNGGPEQKLKAKTTNAAGNPIFSNDEVMWEMTREGHAGILTDKDGNTSEFK